ncbi:hypothetical protein [Ktedonospora formicarum]|uniref:Uncharacterized protein n=1 Tax=Ktedonospora formicarum TaxID=2778364 RepID=A0A8J3I046_9CHLR|nr:hypothetical protein [Ktedonospora formicarum]GHO45166.1 hypothetical protein KSX_33290 [Ktedonospora formicarum]
MRENTLRNFVLGCLGVIVVLFVLGLCVGWVNANVIEPARLAALTPYPTDTPVPPTPTPTPVNLKTHQGVEAYATSVIDHMKMSPYGQFEGVAYTQKTKQLQLLFYIPSSTVLNGNHLKNMIESNCYDVEHAIWTSKLKGVVSTVAVHIQSDLVDRYGHNSKGDAGYVVLKANTEKRFVWDNLSIEDAWNNQIYDEQWLLPDVAKG